MNCYKVQAVDLTNSYVLNSEDYLPVATTRPETLLGDTAVAVNPEVCHIYVLL